MVKIKRYQNTRHLGVWVDERLLLVVRYKKGALAIKDALTNLTNESPAADPIPPKKLKIETKTKILITPVTGD